MKSFYRVLAYLVAAGVVIQAAAVVWAISGESRWINNGGVMDKAVIESREIVFPEVLGFVIHGIFGGMVIPFIALLLLIASFFAKVPGAVKWAGLVFLLIAAQTMLGYSSHDIPVLGALHGLNALLLFSAAIYTGLRVRRAAAPGA